MRNRPVAAMLRRGGAGLSVVLRGDTFPDKRKGVHPWVNLRMSPWSPFPRVLR